MEMFEIDDFKHITVVERDVPEPYLSLKRTLTEFLADPYLPRSNKLHVEKQMLELDKQILNWMITQPISIILKRGE